MSKESLIKSPEYTVRAVVFQDAPMPELLRHSAEWLSAHEDAEVWDIVPGWEDAVNHDDPCVVIYHYEEKLDRLQSDLTSAIADRDHAEESRDALDARYQRLVAAVAVEIGWARAKSISSQIQEE